MLACKCINVTISAKNDDVQNYNTELTPDEKSDPFFIKGPGVVVAEAVTKQQPGLVVSRAIGQWNVHTCLNCSLDTYAVHRDKGASCVLVSSQLTNGSMNIATLRNSDNFSPAFGIIVGGGNPVGDADTELTGWKNIATDTELSGTAQTAASTLQRQLQESLRRELTVTEERVRRYTDQQYSALEAFRERAHHDHQQLLRVIAQRIRVYSDTGKATKEAPAAIVPVIENSSPIPQPVIPDVEPMDSILFPMDGVEPACPTQSDVEESDTDDSASHDEGIHIPRQRTRSFHIAKSLPVNIPVFAHEHAARPDDLDDKENSVDIAASIRALAKSVHGDDVFGDLPRPRFSTQI